MKSIRSLVIVALVPLLAGCAGGWRGGSPPAEWTGASALPTAAATPAAKAAKSTGSYATADGAVFVWKGEGASVAVAGEFNSWNTSADPLVKQDDGSWKLEKKLAAGRYPYKLVLDGNTWKEDPTAPANVDDGYGGKNSVMIVGTSAAPATAAAAPAAPAAGGAATAAIADGAVFRFSGTGGTVNVAGEFNSWSTSADAMKKQADGTWALEKKLAPGRYAYKFVIDGGTWKEDAAAKEFVDDGYGGKNSVVVVGGAGAAPGAAAAPAAAPATAAKPLAPGVKPAAPRASAAGVVFTYAGSARTSVALCGDFNAWATTTHAMQQQADGSWTLTVKIPAGTYGYKFLVDGSNWKLDEGNPQGRDDGFGGKNSVVTVK